MLQVSGETRSGRIACLNWPDASPYRPDASFDIRHSGDALQLHFRVQEDAVRAVCAADREHAWEDSCVEFFFDPHGDGTYYNLECTCTGWLYLCRGTGRHGREFLPEAAYAAISRRCSLARADRLGSGTGHPRRRLRPRRLRRPPRPRQLLQMRRQTARPALPLLGPHRHPASRLPPPRIL